MGVKESHELCSRIVDWYWKYGFSRTGKYALPKGAWLDQLYGIGKQLERLSSGLAQVRPSVAVWGPSQTGKSTLVSKYVDARVKFVGDASLDGLQSGLHFEGGKPAFFLKPEEDPASGRILSVDTCVLNPFNSGLDASACLSRFVLGSPDPADGLHRVKDACYPVELKFVKPIELWQSVARGYDGQCLGPRTPALDDGNGRPAPRYPRTWTREKLMEVFEQHARQSVPAETPPSREAYRLLHDFCDLLEDLMFAELPRFRQLQGGDSDWNSLRHKILSQWGDGPAQLNALHYSVDKVHEFTAAVLWDGYGLLSEYFWAMCRLDEQCREIWKGKPVFCSLEVAALFLDMETYLVYLKPLPSMARPKDVRIHRLVPTIAWDDRGDHIVIGSEGNLPNRLIKNPEHFAMLQGLVWEMVVPLNPEHLEDTPFKSFLAVADLLDFPGVERGGQSGDKIDLEVMARLRSGTGCGEEGTGDRDEPYQFFLRLLKRGKTSSIVSTYARRLSIDTFNIFQDLDRDKPNGNQLIEGVNSWWKHCAPEFYHNPRGKSPLPLNFVLLWWANFFNEGHDFTNLAKKFSGLGPIVDPDIGTAFALNYYGLPRGAIKADRLPQMEEMVARLRAETAFQKHFLNDLSAASFNAMLGDRKSGGTDFFFSRLAEEVVNVTSGAGGRKGLLQKQAENVVGLFEELMKQHELLPDPQPRDFRRDYLARFRKGIDCAVASATERQMIRINHALRGFLDVNFTDLISIPRTQLDIDVDHLRGQLQQWVNSKMNLLDDDANDLKVIGLADRECLHQTLSSLAESIEPDLNGVAAWLRQLRHYAHATNNEEVDLRRHLAISLCNLLVYGPEGPRVRIDTDLGGEEPQPGSQRASEGIQSRYYRDFVEPFVGDGGWLESLTNRQVIPIKRPGQNGDDELVSLVGVQSVAE